MISLATTRKKLSYRSHHPTLESFSSLKPPRQKLGRSLTKRYFYDVAHCTQEIKGSLLSKQVLGTHVLKDYISKKMTLDNYDELANPWEHIQNMHSNLELVIQDIYGMCKILLMTFRWSTRAWYNNLKPDSITGFKDIYTKLVLHFSINIPAKKSST